MKAKMEQEKNENADPSPRNQSMLQANNNVRVITAITPAQLKPLDAVCHTVILNLNSHVSDADYMELAELLKERADILFIVQDAQDLRLEFLRYFAFLKRIRVGPEDLESFDGLRYVSESLEFLSLSNCRKKLSLKFLEHFHGLKALWIDGQDKHFEWIGALKELVWLEMRSIKQEDLSALLPLQNLQKLEITLGSTNNLNLLPDLGKLKFLKLRRIRQLTDLSVVAKLSELRFLFLGTLNKLDRLPSLSLLSKLRWIHIDSLKALNDLTPISEAAALEQLICIDMPQLSPMDFCVFQGHPTLKRAHVGLCADYKNEQVSQILSLPSSHKMDASRSRLFEQMETIYSETGEDILR